MPKKINIHPNERIDIPDYLRGSNGFTEDSIHYVRKTLVSSSDPVYLSGFRIEISNQSTSPGEFTVHNGKAVDQAGRQLHNEDEVTKTATSTLPGASTTYYIEIQYEETETDVDSRTFWDPTFTNSGDQLPGKEFLLNVSTRISSDWVLVSPVSTAGFEKDSNPSSNKIPLAILETNSSGEITGVTSGPASDIAELGVAAGANSVTVLDSSLFPASGDIVIGFGGSNPETVTISGNDYENNVISFSPSLVNTHPAGAIVRQTGSGIPDFVKERKSGTVGSSDTDQQRRMWQGDENRGAVVLTSKETFGERSDLNIRDLKDYVDSLASQLRELKFGTSTVGSLSGELPPLSSSEWSEGRWYNRAGGLFGARSYSVTIGDGINSLGDLNTTSGVTDLGAVLQSAIDAASSDGLSIFVRQGDYVLETTPLINKPLVLEFEEGATVGANVSDAFSVDDSIRAEIRNFKFDSTSGTSAEGNILISTNSNAANLQIYDSSFSSVYTASGGGVLIMENCTLEAVGLYCINLPASYVALDPGSRISECSFSGSGVGSGLLHNLLFEKNTCTVNSGFVFNSKDSSANIAFYPNIIIRDCTFSDVSASSAAPFLFDNKDDVSGPVIENCVFTNINLSAGTPQQDRSIFYFVSTNSFVFRNNDVRDLSITSTTEGSPGYIFNSPFDVPRGVISGCQFGSSGDYVIHVRVRDGSHEITNNYFNNPYIGVQTDSQSNDVGESSIVGNRIVYDLSGTATTDVTGIDSGHLVHSYIAENYIRLVQSDVSSPFEFIGINISQAPGGLTGTEDSHTMLQIANNTIELAAGTNSATTGLAYGINFNDNGATLYVDVKNNKVHGVTQAGTLYGTRLNTSGLFGTFTGNTIKVRSFEDASKLVASYFESLASVFFTVEGNALTVINEHSSPPQSFNALVIIGGGYFVSSNDLTFGAVGAPDVGAVGLENVCGVRLEGPGVSIVGNNFTGAGHPGAGIVVYSGDCEHVKIRGNSFHKQDARNLEYYIVVDANEGVTSIEDLSITNNSFVLSPPMEKCVQIVAFGLTIRDGVSITGNYFYEDVTQFEQDCVGVSAVHYVDVSNNTVVGKHTSSSGGNKFVAFSISGCNQVTINSNSILGWCGSIVSGVTSGKGTAINMSTSDNCSITGNHIQPGETDTAVPEINLGNSSVVHVAANMIYSGDATGAIDSSSATDVTLDANKLV